MSPRNERSASMLRRFDDVADGEQLGPLSVGLTRADLVRYAGASGDFNPIHWNERVAREVGLLDVIAHGMLTMAHAGRLVTEWAGSPAAVAQFGVRFTRPVVVTDLEGGAVELTGKVTERRDDDRTVAVSITARSEGRTVLGKAVARVRLA